MPDSVAVTVPASATESQWARAWGAGDANALAALAHWRIIGESEGLHWPELDEDISVEGLLAGRRSGETPASLRRWFETRKAG